MKTTLTVDVEADLLRAAEKYAKKNNSALSDLIEAYFKRLLMPSAGKNVVQLVRELPESPLGKEADLTQAYYEDLKAKHGF